MHELAICQSIVTQALSVAHSYGSRAIGKITLRIGALAGVEPDLLKAAFPLVAAGTYCARAELAFELIGVSVECKTCGVVSDVRANRLLCGACGGWKITMLSGDEMLLGSIELIAPRPLEAANV